MNSTIKYILTFIAGAGIGSAVTYKLLKVKYEQFAQEQIDSVKEKYSVRKELKTDEEVHELNDEEIVNEAIEDGSSSTPDIKKYAKQLKDLGYTKYSNMSDENDEEQEVNEEPMIDKPYVIPPDEFGEFDEYECISLTYYADKVLADENDELVEDVDNVVGLDSLSRFGEYEDDSVHVRNDSLKCDYEILYDPRYYSDIVK